MPPFRSAGRSLDVRALAALVAVSAFFLVFFLYPLGHILRLGLERLVLPLETARHLGQVFGFTVYQAALSTLLTLALGVPAAFLFARFQFPGREFLRLLIALPFMLPAVVVAAGFNAWLGPRGWLNLSLMRWFGLDAPPIPFIGTLGAILAAHVFYNTIVVVRIVGNALTHLDPRLEQVARSLGARPWQVFWRVTWPLILPSLLAASLLVFLFDFTSFGVVLLLGAPRYATLEVEIYLQAVHFFNLPLAVWLSLLQLLFTLLFSIAYTRLARRLSVAIQPRPMLVQPPRSWRQRLFVLGMSLLLLVFYFLPLVSLPLRSVLRLEAEMGERRQTTYGLTTQYYRELFVNRRGSLFYVPPVQALGNSLLYAALTVLLSLALGFPAAAALARPGRFGRWLEPLFLLPLGASAVTLGLGYLLAFGRWLASPWFVPLAHTVIALPFVVRTLQPVLASIPLRLREAAATLGASPAAIRRYVDWPLARRAVLSAAVFAFTVSLGEFGATALLARPEFPTLTVAIYRFLAQPGALNYGQAMAMATILMLTTGAGILLIEKLRLPASGEF